ncbi:DGQHR domain-containing protein DpdB [Candidatus Uabimicrobium amorphum]|uniref:DGQHR domain-containing protein n=1 Tax=Uabimicrobium amorphum TaxID=2596890 RepID=A0A5S9ISV6_UABAM|nr:DGQHR domain-containing protein DpdB [Candidatus Uabimicrobium amorphum]BBM87117.1 hypothetical protein UABAM_05520 [Candidatus Uabimicrobium amorphum]
MSKTLKVRTLCTKQDKTTIYSFFLPGKLILEIADISRIKKDQNEKLLGYQRNEVNNHVKEIVEYLDSKNIIFPNSIILAISSAVSFKQSRGPQVGGNYCTAGILEIPKTISGKKPAWIVDGQQRSLALMKCKNKNLVVPITAFISDDFEVHRTQFLLVNKVKPLPKGLINELLPEVNTLLPPSLAKNKIPSAICNLLNKDPESPFRGLIIRQTTDRKIEKAAVVTDNSIIQMVRSSLNNPHGCLYQYKNVASGEIDFESVRLTLNLYWGVVKDLFPNAWGKPATQSRLMHGVGIKSMSVLMDRVMVSHTINEKNLQQTIKQKMSIIPPVCAWTEGKWEHLGGIQWNHLQNTSSHIKLLSNMLIRVYMGVN